MAAIGARPVIMYVHSSIILNRVKGLKLNLKMIEAEVLNPSASIVEFSSESEPYVHGKDLHQEFNLKVSKKLPGFLRSPYL